VIADGDATPPSSPIRRSDRRQLTGRPATAPKQKAAVLVAKRIVAQVERLRLRPGDKLPPERAMLEEFRVARSTLREALRFLELQGVISLRTGPGGGPVVREPGSTHLAATLALVLQFKDAPYRVIVDARVALEPVMAGLAAPRISEAELAELRRANELMASRQAELEAFLTANQRFHDVIALASGNALFAAILEALLGIMDGTAIGIDYPPQAQVAIAQAHRDIYAALAARDAEAATAAMRRHTLDYLRYAERRYPHVLERRVTWDLLPL